MNNDKNCGRDDRDIDRRSSDEIKHDIDRTLSSMDQAVTQLQGRMTIRGIVNEITGGLAEGGGASGIARKASGRVWEAAKHNPVPAALIGVGIAWLIADRMGGREKDHHEVGRGRDRDWLSPGAEYIPGRPARAGQWSGESGPGIGEKVGDKLGDVRDKATGAIGSVKERVSEFAQSARERVSGLTHSAREHGGDLRDRASHLGERAREKLHGVSDAVQTRAVHLRHQTEDLYEGSPMAFGAAAVALGLMGGLLVPSTRKEEELMGEASDRLKGKARELGRTALHEGAQVAQAIKQEVVGEGDTRMVDKAREVVRSVIETGREQIKQKVQGGQGGNVPGRQEFGRPEFGNEGQNQFQRPGPAGQGQNQGQNIGDQSNVD
jgi:ElaB/YqjD/DUF883 family membrane-anchored ribosome-binding protein